jgi:FMN phosphatase YigB (HAD superfamily)
LEARAFDLAHGCIEGRYDTILIIGQVINNTFQMFLKPNQQVPPALISELLHTFSSRKGYRLYPDVKDFFDELQNPTISKRTGSLEPPWPYKKIVVGVITNSDDRISGILESLSLKVGSKRFGQTAQFTVQPAVKNDIDFVVHSYDAGHEKPDKRIFNAATSVLDELLARDGEGLTSNDFEKLYVGDDVEKDYEGATAAGWHAVLVDRNGVMRRARGFEFGQVGMRNKQGREFKVKMAKTLLHLDQWLPIKETWDKPFPRR